MGPEVPWEGWYLLFHHPFCGSGRNHAEEAPAERSLGWLQTSAPGVLAWDFLSSRKRAGRIPLLVSDGPWSSPETVPALCCWHPPGCQAGSRFMLSLQLWFSLQEFPQSANRLPPRITALPLASDLRYSQWITVLQSSQEALASSFVRNFVWIPSKSDKIWVAGPLVTSKGLKGQQPDALLAQGCSFALKWGS